MGAVGTNNKSTVVDNSEEYDYTNPTHFDDEVSHTLKWMQNEKLSNYNEWEEGLTSQQKHAISEFTGSEYHHSFAELYDTPWEQMTPQEQKIAQNLYDALNGFELRKPIVVYRKADTKIFGSDNMSVDDLKALEGEIVHSNGFMSTAAGTHGYGVNSSQVEMEITIPKSVGAGAFVAYKSSIGSGEREFLLNNNGFFKVNKVIPGAGHKGATKVEMQWVGQSKDQIFAKDTPTEKKAGVPTETVSKTKKKKKG